MTRVLIAGGGVAAIEAMLALHALAEDRVEIELLGPEPHFWYRPLSVAEPFGVPKATRHEVGALVAAAGCGTFTLGALRGIDAGRHEATTSVGGIGYDIALVAVGAVPSIVVPGALTFRGPADDEKICSLLLALEAWNDPARRICRPTWGFLAAATVRACADDGIPPSVEEDQRRRARARDAGG